MMGGHHAISGAAAWVAVTSTVPFTLGLHPLPVGELAVASQRGPLVVVDAGDAASGLAVAVAGELPGSAGPGVAAWRGTAPGAADIAAAVRRALGV